MSGSGGTAAGDGGAVVVKGELGVLVPSDLSSIPSDPPFVQREHATYSPFTAYCQPRTAHSAAR